MDGFYFVLQFRHLSNSYSRHVNGAKAAFGQYIRLEVAIAGAGVGLRDLFGYHWSFKEDSRS